MMAQSPEQKSLKHSKANEDGFVWIFSAKSFGTSLWRWQAQFDYNKHKSTIEILGFEELHG